MTNQNQVIRCPVCGSTQTRLFFTQHQVPTRAGYLAPTRPEALECELGEITLQHCRTCAHIWNSSFDPDKLGFNQNYDFSQFHSATYREYISASIERLLSRYSLVGKTALEVGCGKGDNLRLLIQAGMAKGIGFDPTFVEGNFTEDECKRITIHRKYYGADDSELRPDLVTCRSALQYIPKPRVLLDSLRKTLEGQFETVIYFEVTNGAEAFKEKIVWYVMYEAGCFFSPPSLARLFRECGFQVLDILPALGSSQLEIEAKPSPAPKTYRSESPELIGQIEAQLVGFESEFDFQVKKWTAKFEQYRKEGKRVVLWASGMRAISLLVNVPPAGALVDRVVDVNPQRQGRYMPKTGQPVVAPAELVKQVPDVVIATNPNYAQEIAAQMRDLGIQCDFEVLR